MIVAARVFAYTVAMPGKPRDPGGRPVFLGLSHIRFPVGAIASITHRITGVVLALAVPAAVVLMAYSAQAPYQFQRVAAWLDSLPGVLGVALVAAAATHHLLAGVRVLVMDAGHGESLTTARRTAWGSLAGAVVAGIATLVGMLL